MQRRVLFAFLELCPYRERMLLARLESCLILPCMLPDEILPIAVDDGSNASRCCLDAAQLDVAAGIFVGAVLFRLQM